MVLVLLTIGWPAAASAAASCSLQAASGQLLAFGSYSGLGGDLDAIGQITVVCVPDLPLGLAVSYSISASAGSGDRKSVV